MINLLPKKRKLSKREMNLSLMRKIMTSSRWMMIINSIGKNKESKLKPRMTMVKKMKRLSLNLSSQAELSFLELLIICSEN